MKHRVRCDLSFDTAGDAKALVDLLKKGAELAVSINEGGVNEEISFIEYHLCGHDEGLPCEKPKRIEIRRSR